MLESNTEAKQATGTGSKLGDGVAQKGEGAAKLPSGTLGEDSGVLPSPWQEGHALESQLASQRMRDKGAMGRPRLERQR